MRSAGVALPYSNEGALVRDVINSRGEIGLFRERFDRKSWRSLPRRVRVVRGHARHHPLGWAELANGDDALRVVITWADTSAGRDAFVEVSSGLMPDLSVGFVANLKADSVSREPGKVPVILRRDVELAELSLVSAGAYVGARIETADLDAVKPQFSASDQATLDSALASTREFRVRRRLDDLAAMAPSMARIAERKRADEQRRADDAELLASAIATAAQSRELAARIAAERERKREPEPEVSIEEWAELRWREEIRAEHAQYVTR